MKFQLRRIEEPDLNMTSLIDVVLLLLIFFMLSTKFIDEGRLQKVSQDLRRLTGRPARLVEEALRVALMKRRANLTDVPLGYA